MAPVTAAILFSYNLSIGIRCFLKTQTLSHFFRVIFFWKKYVEVEDTLRDKFFFYLLYSFLCVPFLSVFWKNIKEIYNSLRGSEQGARSYAYIYIPYNIFIIFQNKDIHGP